MADFRKWIFALAVVALLAGLSVPASAQSPFQCSTSQSVVPIVRAEGYTELVGDIVLSCTGGIPTVAGAPVPQVTFTIFLNTNVTSKITTNPLFNNAANFNLNFDEALLLVDEPNSPLRLQLNPPANPNPILNCGNTGAPDTGVSGYGVCNIISTGNPAQTYDGTGGVQNATPCTATAPLTPNSATYGCGRPNVFQGRQGTPQNPGQFNAVSFLAVPVDPPGTALTRTFRFTNIRANAVGVGVSTTFTTAQIQANIAINGPTTMTISNPQQIVAYVNRGLTSVSLFRNKLDFVQCNDENPDLHKTTTTTQTLNFQIPSYLGNQGANFGTNGADATPMVRFLEGFATSWKTKNLSYIIGNPPTNVTGNGFYDTAAQAWRYNTPARNAPADVAQNVPGANYNTESGFMWNGGIVQNPPNPNPPPGFFFQAITTPQGLALKSGVYSNPYSSGLQALSNDTGINLAGTVSQGTRLSLSYSNVPSGASIWTPPVLYLYRQGSPYHLQFSPNPTLADPAAGLSGVAVKVNLNDAAGAGGIGFVASAPGLVNVGASNLVVYEILYSDPGALELLDIPTVVAYVSNPSQNLPTPNVTTQARGGFAPFYTTTAAALPAPLASQAGPGLPAGGLPIPRFTPGTGPLDLFLINRCACNLLFPYVVSTAGFDTGIAIANSSADPGATYGFFGVPQPGRVTFWYYGIMAGGAAVPGPQTSKSVPAGQVLTYVASSGSTDWGLDNRAAGLIGYVITQAEFQYCHAFAYISALGAGPLTPGTSEGYLGIVLDRASLNRTLQLGENKGH
jgi:hypothetical protein